MGSEIQQKARERQKEAAVRTNESRLRSNDPKRSNPNHENNRYGSMDPQPSEPAPKTNTNEELAKLAESNDRPEKDFLTHTREVVTMVYREISMDEANCTYAHTTYAHTREV